ncbi:hypothetical protein ACFU7Y_03905 [Kitasatospora sp. NPDC057542]|uniref:hypothetical protein n=1 Tax=Streptomycetaceae TaxID=2062 RepID=UPI001CCF211C|nr:hypothetical protein [Streptomyces sp. LS1784]
MTAFVAPGDPSSPPHRLEDPRFHRHLGDVARHGGAFPAVGALQRAAGERVLITGPTGHGVAPAAELEAAQRTWPSGRTLEQPLSVRPVFPVPPADGALFLVETESGPGTTASTASACDAPSFAVALLRLRLGLSLRLYDACFGYLGGRTVAGEPLLRRQLVKGALADAVADQVAVETLLAPGGRPDAATHGDLHRQLTDTDRGLLRLLGASGFLADGPGATAHVSELLADVYALAPLPPTDARTAS